MKCMVVYQEGELRKSQKRASTKWADMDEVTPYLSSDGPRSLQSQGAENDELWDCRMGIRKD